MQQKRLKQEINRDGSKLSKETIHSISEVAKLFIDVGMVTPFRADCATRSLLLEGDFIKKISSPCTALHFYNYIF